eukprot:1214997-Rhodomonas_salina.2
MADTPRSSSPATLKHDELCQSHASDSAGGEGRQPSTLLQRPCSCPTRRSWSPRSWNPWSGGIQLVSSDAQQRVAGA